MDLWDFTMLKPGREAFKKKLEFGKLRAPHDTFSQAVGQRWFVDSGGEALKNDSKSDAGYQDYVNEKKEVSAVDQEQIAKDLKRTKASSMSQATVKAFLGQIPPADMKDRLHNILGAFCIRHRTLGYAQGMDYIVMFLLGFQTEEQAFWTFCAIVEKILPTDFYSPAPQSMNGYMAEKKLILKLACDCFPQIVKAISANQLKATLDIMAPKWMICLFVDCVPLDCQCMIFESFFYREGHMGILPVVCTILQDCVDEVLQGEDILITLMEKAKQVTGPKLKEGLQQRKFEFEPQRVDGVRQEARKELAQQWNVGGIFELHGQTNFSQEQLSEFQLGFRKLYKKNKQGLPLSLFSEVLKRSAPQLPDSISARIFHVYDSDNRHALNFAELISIMSCLCVGSPVEKTILCFQIFDTSNGGFLSTDEVEAMCATLMAVLELMFTAKRDDKKDGILGSPNSEGRRVSTPDGGKPRLIGHAANTLKGGISKIKQIKQTIQQGVQELVHDEQSPATIHTRSDKAVTSPVSEGQRGSTISNSGNSSCSSSSSCKSVSSGSGSSSRGSTSPPHTPNPLSPSTPDEFALSNRADAEDLELFQKAELLAFKVYFETHPLAESLLTLMHSSDPSFASSEPSSPIVPSLLSSTSTSSLTITVPTTSAETLASLADILTAQTPSTLTSASDSSVCISPLSDAKTNSPKAATVITSTGINESSTVAANTSLSVTQVEITTTSDVTATIISGLSLEASSSSTSTSNAMSDALPSADEILATTISSLTTTASVTATTPPTGTAMSTTPAIGTITAAKDTPTSTTTVTTSRNSALSSSTVTTTSTSTPAKSVRTVATPKNTLTPPTARAPRSSSKSRSRGSEDSTFDEGFEIIEAKPIGPKMTYAAFTKFVASKLVLQNFLSKVFSARMVLDNTSDLKQIKRAEKANKWKLW